MKNYNEEFFRWLDRVRELDPKGVNDLPDALQEEFKKLMFLADIPFREIFGDDPEGVCDLLQTVLLPSEVFDRNGEPMKIMLVEPDRVFVSPVNRLVAQAPLYAEDAEGRCFVFLYCDDRGPCLGEAAAVFDAIHEPLREKGVPKDDLPDVYFVFITDYDLGRHGRQVIRLDRKAEEADLSHITDEEWRARGCDPAQPDPVLSKWHTIFFNATIVS